MNREQKSQIVDRLSGALAEVPAVVVAGFSGLTVEATDSLRSEMRAAGVSYEVVKNTLAKRAVAGTDKEGMTSLFKGNTAIAFHEEDPAIAAKIIKKFSKDNPAITLKGGWIGGEVLDETTVEKLANLLSKDELRAKLLSVFSAPASSFARVLQAKVDAAGESTEA